MSDLPQPTTPRGEATRQKLLDAAEEEFGAKGFSRASVSSITSRAALISERDAAHFDGRRYSYAELDDRATKLAGQLHLPYVNPQSEDIQKDIRIARTPKSGAGKILETELTSLEATSSLDFR